MNSARDEIIAKIKSAISSRSFDEISNSYEEGSIFHKTNLSPFEQFIVEFKNVSGEIILGEGSLKLSSKLRDHLKSKNITKLFCKESSLQKFLKVTEIPYLSESEDFESMEAGITNCEFLVADTGSIIISSKSSSGRQLNVFPPIHIVYADISQLKINLEEGIKSITKKYGDELPSLISTITGPSRTADIEKTLVMGAHGPKELIVLLNTEKH